MLRLGLGLRLRLPFFDVAFTYVFLAGVRICFYSRCAFYPTKAWWCFVFLVFFIFFFF